VRGQSTKNNARTRKGRKKTVATRKKLLNNQIMAKKTGALKKKVVKVEPTGHAHVHSSFNNNYLYNSD